MRRSKLEMYIDILDVLSIKPLKVTHITYKANINCAVLKETLDFLMTNGLVEERVMNKGKGAYALTKKGLSVLKAFREIKQVFPFYEEETKEPMLF